jgi:hypothetical protein
MPPGHHVPRVNAPAVALVLLVLFHLGINVAWLSKDKTMRAFDQIPHTAVQIAGINHLRWGGLSALPSALRGASAWHWPAAGYFPISVASLLLGQTIPRIRLANMIYFGILLLSVFLIGRRLYTWQVGLLGATLVSFYPVIFGASRQFGVDFPGCAMVSLSLYVLLTTESFHRWDRSTLFGVSVGLSVLVRPHSIFFIAAPSALSLICGLIRSQDRSRLRIVGHALTSAIVGAAVSAVFWLGRLQMLAEDLLRHTRAVDVVPEAIEGTSLGFYLRALPEATSPFLLAVCGVGLLCLFLKALGRRDASFSTSGVPASLFLSFWAGCGFVFLCLVKIHLMRFLFPLLAPLALITAHGLLSVDRRWLRRALVASALAISAASCLLCSFYPLENNCALSLNCGSGDYSGIPGEDEIYVVGEKIADALERRHGEGRSVLIQMSEPDRHEADATIYIATLISSRLPYALFTQRPFDDYVKDPALEPTLALNQVLGGMTFPKVVRPHRYCYSLLIAKMAGGGEDPAAPDPHSLPERKILAYTVLAFNQIYRVILWYRAHCPPLSRG